MLSVVPSLFFLGLRSLDFLWFYFLLCLNSLVFKDWLYCWLLRLLYGLLGLLGCPLLFFDDLFGFIDDIASCAGCIFFGSANDGLSIGPA